jgi:hypothetical protein
LKKQYINDGLRQFTLKHQILEGRMQKNIEINGGIKIGKLLRIR